MGAELERGDHSEVAPAPAEGPEQVRVFSFAGGDQFTLCGDDICRKQAATGHSERPAQPSLSSSQRKAPNARS